VIAIPGGKKSPFLAERNQFSRLPGIAVENSPAALDIP
jgi:hypothetical protein